VPRAQRAYTSPMSTFAGVNQRLHSDSFQMSRARVTRERATGVGAIWRLACFHHAAPPFEAWNDGNNEHLCGSNPVHQASLAPHDREFTDP
jgi:hypothetical protein